MFQNLTKQLRSTVAAIALAATLHSSIARAQPLPNNNNYTIDPGALGSVLVNPGTAPLIHMPTNGMTQRCVPINGLPLNDFAEYAFGVANIGIPFQAAQPPLFAPQAGIPNPLVPLPGFLGTDDVLLNPGTHYHSLQLNNTAPIPQARAYQTYANPRPLITHTGLGGTRFGAATAAITQGTITAAISDKKTPNDRSASYGIVTFEETYAVTAPVSLGGALAFNVTLPRSIPSIGQLPGAAAVALVTTVVATPGTIVKNQSTGAAIDANCFRLASMIASASAGITDGIDNVPFRNTGPQENFFGNADVATLVSGAFPLTGAMSITSSSGVPNEFYRVTGSWTTPVLSFTNAFAPVKITLRHTLTMIADPGASIELDALTNEEFNGLPHAADVFILGSGKLILAPEPAAFSLACVGAFPAVRIFRRRRAGSVVGRNA